jgi:hypothetical protein
MGRTCSMHGQDEKYLQTFSQKIRRDYFEDLRINVRIILKWTLNNKGDDDE